MAAGIVVARLAGPTVLGTVAFGMSFVAMFQFIADLGIGSAHVKLVSEGRDLATCNATFARIKIILVAAFFVVVLGSIVVQQFVLRSDSTSGEYLFVLIIWLVALACGQLSLIPSSTFTALTQQAKLDVPAFFQSILIQCLRIGAVVLGLGAIGLSTAQLLGTIAILLVYFRMYQVYPRGKFDRQLAMEYVKIGLPIVVIGFSSTLLEYLDRVMLQYYGGTDQVGYYAAAYSISGFIKTIGLTVGLLFFPLFSSAVAKNDFDYVNRTIGKFERFTCVFIMPFVVCVAILSSPIIRLLLGSKFAPSAPVVAVLVIGLFFYLLNIPYGNLLTGMNRFVLGAILYSASLVLFIVLNTIVLTNVPAGSQAFGTALALSTSTVVLGYSFRASIRRLTREVDVWRYQKYVVLGLVATVGGKYVSRMMETDTSIVGAILFGMMLIVAIYGFMFVTKWVTKNDMHVLLQVVNARKVYGYIRTELSGE
jgi:O-antigen/teichoic acid export membrane protein